MATTKKNAAKSKSALKAAATRKRNAEEKKAKDNIIPPTPGVEVARTLSFGEKAVGLTFNPSNDPYVQDTKQAYASIIDNLNWLRTTSPSAEVKRLAEIAIKEAQAAQMWAVKAITWKD
jgi:hypothetical protein